MLIYAIIAIAVVYVIGIFVLPVTVWRDNMGTASGSNIPGFIWMKRGLDSSGPTWAQEFYEARRGWQLLPVHLILMMIGRISQKLAFYERNFEINGHERSVQAEHMLTGADIKDTRAFRSRALARNYVVFRGYDPLKIQATMATKSANAEKFVRRHFRRIEKMNVT